MNKVTCQGCGKEEESRRREDNKGIHFDPPNGWVYLGTMGVDDNKGGRTVPIYLCPLCDKLWPNA